MNRNLTIAIFIGVIISLITAVFYFTSDSRVDWNKTYNRNDANPYGCLITYDLLPSLFGEENIVPIAESIGDKVEVNVDFYDFMENNEIDTLDFFNDEINAFNLLEDQSYFDNYFWKDNPLSNYIFISDYFQLFSYDGISLDYHIKNGNTCLIAAHHIETNIPILQNIKIKPLLSDVDSVETLFGGKSINYKPDDIISYIDFDPQLDAEVLLKTDDDKAIVLKINTANGAYIICSTPELLTNFYILKRPHEKVAASILSHMPAQTETIWAGNYLSKIQLNFPDSEKESSGSIMQFIHSEPALSWAFYLAIFSVIVFMIFGAKRRQRIMKPIPPVRNSTLDFVNTVSNLYWREQNHKNMANKKIAYFAELINTKLHIRKIDYNDQQFIERLASRSGNTAELTKRLFDQILVVKNAPNIGKEQLISLTKLINKFCHGIRK